MNNEIPDKIVPSNNEYGIPLLPLSRCAKSIVAPLLIWGFQRRSHRAGTLAFYTDDYRFSALWTQPERIMIARPSVIIEPNFTLQNDQPLVVALWQTFRKRWLARLWASWDVDIIVDLNVGSRYSEANLLGIPKGWHAFATRGAVDDMGGLMRDYDIACSFHADPLFVVYGGGQMVRDECMRNGWLHIEERIDHHGE